MSDAPIPDLTGDTIEEMRKSALAQLQPQQPPQPSIPDIDAGNIEEMRNKALSQYRVPADIIVDYFSKDIGPDTDLQARITDFTKQYPHAPQHMDLPKTGKTIAELQGLVNDLLERRADLRDEVGLQMVQGNRDLFLYLLQKESQKRGMTIQQEVDALNEAQPWLKTAKLLGITPDTMKKLPAAFKRGIKDIDINTRTILDMINKVSGGKISAEDILFNAPIAPIAKKFTAPEPDVGLARAVIQAREQAENPLAGESIVGKGLIGATRMVPSIAMSYAAGGVAPEGSIASKVLPTTFWSEQMIGDSYADLKSRGASDKSAMMISIPAGIIQGVIEQIQIEGLEGVGGATKKAVVANLAKRFFKETVLEEGSQAVVQSGARMLAPGVEWNAGDELTDAVQQVIAAGPVMAVLMVPGMAGSFQGRQFTDAEIRQGEQALENLNNALNKAIDATDNLSPKAEQKIIDGDPLSRKDVEGVLPKGNSQADRQAFADTVRQQLRDAEDVRDEGAQVQQEAEVEIRGFHTTGSPGGGFVQRSAGKYIALDAPFGEGTVQETTIKINPKKIFDPNGVVDGTDIDQSSKDFDTLLARLNERANAGKIPDTMDGTAKARTEILQEMGYEAEAGWIDGPEDGQRELVVFPSNKSTKSVTSTPTITKEQWRNNPSVRPEGYRKEQYWHGATGKKARSINSAIDLGYELWKKSQEAQVAPPPRLPPEISRKAIVNAFPGASVNRLPNGAGYRVELQSGQSILVQGKAEIPVNWDNAEQALGRKISEAERNKLQAAGSFVMTVGDVETDALGIINIATNIDQDQIARHEGLHFANQAKFFTEAEWNALVDKYSDRNKPMAQQEEDIATAREAWTPKDGLLTQLKAFFNNLLSKFGLQKLSADTVEYMMSQSDFWARKPMASKQRGEQYAIRDVQTQLTADEILAKPIKNDLSKDTLRGRDITDLIRFFNIADGYENQSPTISRFIDAIEPLLKNIRVTLIDDFARNPNVAMRVKYDGTFNVYIPNVQRHDAKRMAETAIHEAIHILVGDTNVFNDKVQTARDTLYEKIEPLMDAAIGLRDDSRFKHSFSSPREFLADAWSKSDFQSELAKIKATEKSSGSIWERVKNYIVSFLRDAGAQGGQSLLEQIVNVSSQQFSEFSETNANVFRDYQNIPRMYSLRARPDLANPAIDQRARDVVDEVDELRNQMGQPEVRHDVDVNAEADARLQKNYAVERERLISIAKRGGQLNDVETVMAKRIINQEVIGAIESNNADTMRDARSLIDAYRRTGAEQARSFRQRRDLVETPAQRRARVLGEAILLPNEKTQTKIDKAKRNGDNETAKKLEDKWEKDSDKIRKDLADAGIDLNNLNEYINDPIEMSKITRALSTAKAEVSDVLFEYWNQSILSGPTTAAANTIGNTAHTGWDFTAERFVEALVNTVVRDPKAAQFGEFKYILRGILPGLSRGARNMIMSWNTELPYFEASLGLKEHTKFDTPRVAIKGKIGRFIRSFGYRHLLATDEMAKTLIANMEVGAQAYRQAKAEGLNGHELSLRIAELVNDTQSAAWSLALDKARELTFQKEADPTTFSGKLQKGILNLRRDIPGIRWIIPYVTTPANIFRIGIKKSPVGALQLPMQIYEASKTGDWSNVTKTTAQQIIAWGIFLALIGSNDEDDPWITGAAAEQDFKTSYMARRTHPAQSVKIGDTWYNYGRIEPFATVLALMVDAANGIKSKDAGRGFTAPFKSLVGQMRDKTFLSGLGDLLEAVQDPDRKGAKWASSFAASWVPNIIRSSRREMDDTYAQRGVWGKGSDYYKMLAKRTAQKTEIPQAFGTAKDLPIYDLWGRQAKRSTSPVPRTDWLWRVTVPVRTKPEDMFIGDRMLINWNLQNPGQENYPLVPAKYYKDKKQTVYWTEEQYQEYCRLSGEKAREKVERYYSNKPNSVANPTQEDIDRITKYIRDARSWAKTKVLSESQ